MGITVYDILHICLLLCTGKSALSKSLACGRRVAKIAKQETKGLSLEQVDQMMDEVSPRKSAAWRPHTTFAEATGLAEKGVALENDAQVDIAPVDLVEETMHQKSVV